MSPTSLAPLPRRDRDAVIRTLAAPQHGVVARAQLVAAGVPAHGIDHRLRDGRLEGLFRGVYRVPAPLAGRYEREMAAVLACGHDALLSHRSATAVWTLLPAVAGEPVEEVSMRGTYRVPGPSVRVHRVTRLDAADRTVAHGIPITTPARTIVDIAATATARELEQALAVAERDGLATPDEVARALARRPGRRGAGILRALLDSAEPPAFARSEAEELLLALVRSAGLPAPRTNVIVCGFEVDFLWSAAGLVVEIDGFEFHRSREAFERDRRRDADLMTAGYRVMRVTWRQLRDESHVVLARLARALATTTGQ
ncbi:MAG TPA: type IV toxin-antitoxin system AbiEi family antitoxin domain-containing protein [Longimicrobiales bacterium]|nr:type IV toxin-antitoxin system AbiEi family antitoxin domain-containing protein [Longimicrobiales bacterium]